jgi:glycosyltransferase involved in cell wall biosynthesis
MAKLERDRPDASPCARPVTHHTRSVLLVSNFLSGRLTPGVADALAAELRGAGWRVITTSAREGRVARLADMLSTIARRRNDYDVAQVDVYGTLAFRWAEASCAMLRLVGRPYVLTLHGGSLPALAARAPRRVRRLLTGAAAVTVPSRFLLDQMREFRSDLRLVPNALDTGAYRVRVRTAVRPRLVWMRSFHRVYDPTLAVRVLQRLDGYDDAHLTMIGPDKGDGSREAVRDAVARAGLESRVTLAGLCAKRDVPLWLDRGDIFLNTTTADNTPVSVIEAMASGLCVVSTDVGGLPYLLEHGRDALLVPPGNADRMASAVRRLVEDPLLARSLAAAARAKALQFDWTAVLAAWEQLLAAAALRGARHGGAVPDGAPRAINQP